jgi:hypothetical protein
MDIEKMKAWAESDAGEAYFKDLAEKEKLEEARHMRFKVWLETNDFDNLMYRLILEHNDEYIDNCYHKGYMPYANNKLNFVIGYVVENHEPIRVSELDCDFPNNIWQFRGYYFQHIHGQGTITRIYNKDDNRLLLQI